MAKRGEGWAGLAGNNLLIVGLASPYVISTAQFGSREKGKRAQKNKTLDLLILTVLATTTSELEPVSPWARAGGRRSEKHCRDSDFCWLLAPVFLMPIYLWCGTSFYALKCSETNWARNAIKVTTTTMYWSDLARSPSAPRCLVLLDNRVTLTEIDGWQASWPADRSMDGCQDGQSPQKSKRTIKKNNT